MDSGGPKPTGLFIFLQGDKDEKEAYRDAEDPSKDSSQPNLSYRSSYNGEEADLAVGVAKPQGFGQGVLMDSAPYAHYSCDKCRPHREAVDDQMEWFEASGYVWNWVDAKVRESEYIWEASKRCKGCCEVYEFRTLVLGHLLYKLGVKVR